MDNYSALASLLDNSLLHRKAIERITLTNPELTLSDAYQIRNAGIQLREQRGEKVVGYKLGLTSQAKQQQMHINTPIYGILTHIMQVKNNQQISLQHYIQPKVEPEIAFILGKDLRGSFSADEAMAACSGVCAALDIIDSRYIDFKFTLVDVVADNTSAGGFVLGPIHQPDKFDLSSLTMKLINNNEVMEQGNSSAISGNPINSLILLSAMLAEQDSYIKAGSIILSGAATNAFTLQSQFNIVNETEKLGNAAIATSP